MATRQETQVKLEAEASVHGATILRQGRNVRYRIYMFKCKHEQEVQTGNIRSGEFRCTTCLQIKLESEAGEYGATLLGAGGNNNNRTYLLSCGHEQEIPTTNMRTGSSKCATCRQNKLESEAGEYGATLLGAGGNNNNRTYLLSCGHEQEVQSIHMRVGSFTCQQCEDTSRTLPSYIYLLQISNKGKSFLKLGYAKSIDSRSKQYRLPADAMIKQIAATLLPTGKEAHAREEAIHQKHKSELLSKRRAKSYGMEANGFTECYPVEMLSTLREELSG